MTLLYLVLWLGTVYFGVHLIDYLRRSGFIENEIDYAVLWLAIVLVSAGFFMMADREWNKPPVPEIHRYAPDHVHIDYK